MQNSYGWGINPFYYLAGKYSIHPSYIQEMLQDKRYTVEDLLAVIDFLKINGGKKFSLNTLEAARHFYSNKPGGDWDPKKILKGKTVLILGSGPGIKKYRTAIENYINETQPYVIALNTQSDIKQDLINARAACHPIRLLADCKDHLNLPQPLITPYSMLPETTKKNLVSKEILDFGITIKENVFRVFKNHCEISAPLVIAYLLAVVNSGKVGQILLAGFDGFTAEDPRRKEMDSILKTYSKCVDALPLSSITPTRYNIPVKSIFGLNF